MKERGGKDNSSKAKVQSFIIEQGYAFVIHKTFVCIKRRKENRFREVQFSCWKKLSGTEMIVSLLSEHQIACEQAPVGRAER